MTKAQEVRREPTGEQPHFYLSYRGRLAAASQVLTSLVSDKSPQSAAGRTSRTSSVSKSKARR